MAFFSTLIFSLALLDASSFGGEYARPLWLAFSLYTLASIGYSSVRLYKKKSKQIGTVVVYSSVFFFILTEPALNIIWGEPILNVNNSAPVSDLNLAYSLSIVCLSYFCITIGYHIKTGSINIANWLQTLPGPRNSKSLLYLCTVMIIVGIIPYILMGNGLSGLLDLIVLGRSQTGYVQSNATAAGGDAVSSLLTFIFLSGGILSLYGALKDELPKSIRLLFLFLLLVCLVVTFSGGTRTRLGFVLVPGLLLMAKKVQKQQKKRRLLWIAAIVSTTVYLMIIQVSYRYVGWDQVSIGSRARTTNFGYSLNREVFNIVKIYDDPFSGLSCDTAVECFFRPLPETIYYFAANPIPRSLWSSKPIDPSFIDYNYRRTGASGLQATSNITPTFIGRYYMRYGIFGVLWISLIIGYLTGIANRLFFHTNKPVYQTLVASVILYYLWQSGRDFTPGWLYPVGIIVLVGHRFKSSQNNNRLYKNL